MKKGGPSEPVLLRKGFKAALEHFLEQQFPQFGGPLLRERIVQAIIALFEEYHPPTERFKMGQMLWYAVDVNEKAGYGKRIENCHLRPVVLDLIHEDIEAVIQGEAKKVRQQKTAVRLFKQSYDQKGVLTLSDVASMMRLCPATVSRYIREYEEERGEVVPRRGTIHDMGRTVTHKRIICRKHFREGRTVEQTARETHHSTAAATRYINGYKRVYECLKAGWSLEKISFATSLSLSLTKEYVDLIKENALSN